MAKFQSHTPISQLVEIGGITFHWLHSVELVVVAVLLASSVASRSAWRIGVSIALAILWSLQQWWLFPTMDANTRNVIAGGAPSGDGTHIVFAALEALKLPLLVAAGISVVSSRPASAPGGLRSSRTSPAGSPRRS